LDLVTETPTYYTSQSCKTRAKQQEGARLRNCRDTDGVEFKITAEFSEMKDNGVESLVAIPVKVCSA